MVEVMQRSWGGTRGGGAGKLRISPNVKDFRTWAGGWLPNGFLPQRHACAELINTNGASNFPSRAIAPTNGRLINSGPCSPYTQKEKQQKTRLAARSIEQGRWRSGKKAAFDPGIPTWPIVLQEPGGV